MADEPRWIATPQLRPDFGGPEDRTYVPFADPATAAPMLDQLRALAERQGERPAVECDGEVTTYAELWQAIGRLAAAIVRSGAPAGHAAILLPPGPAYVTALFACLAARRPCVPLDDGFPEARNAQIAAQTNVALVLCTPERAAAADGPGVTRLAVTMRGAPRSAVPDVPPRDAAIDVGDGLGIDEPAFILCTSGSAGQPKAIVHSQRTLLHWVRTTNRALHVRPEDRALTISSLSSLGGCLGMLNFLLAGACLQMLDLKTHGLPVLLQTLASRPVTLLRAAPSMLRSLARLPEARAALAGLRAVQTYGEPLLRADLADWRAMLPSGCAVLSTYGSTEATGLGGYVDAADAAHDAVRVAAGVLMPDTVAAIVGEDGRSCADGEAGELWIRSRYNALGEWLAGRLVAGRLAPHPSGDGTRVYRTGDLARCHADGVFVVLGRIDRMAKVNGQRLEPAEIEVLLRGQAEVSDAEVVVVRGGAGQGDRLVAFVVAADGAPADWPARLRTALRAALPAFMVPSRIVAVGSMPRLPGGKVDGVALAALAAAPSPQPPAAP